METLKNPQKYIAANETYLKNRTPTGLPKDGFYEGMNGHITRSDNRIRTIGISEVQRDVLKQRKENSRLALVIYKANQLGVLKDQLTPEAIKLRI